LNEGIAKNPVGFKFLIGIGKVLTDKTQIADGKFRGAVKLLKKER
jgi:hypothetical protein